jgi:hypothetical protein
MPDTVDRSAATPATPASARRPGPRRRAPRRAPEAGAIAYCKIHPGLGIARLGDSPDEFFIGPEAPGDVPAPHGGFKDRKGRIKRQAARFRVYAYDAQDRALGELTASEADLKWSVRLANAKAAYQMFLGRYWDLQYPQLKGQHPLRNQEISDEGLRDKLLVIRPEAVSIAGRDEHGAQYQMSGTLGPLPYTPVTADTRAELTGSRSGFMNVPIYGPDSPVDPSLGKELTERAVKYHWQPGVMQQPTAESPQARVYLGEVRTDAHGRLLVLGGRGQSASLIPENPVGYLNQDSYYANNDYWHDDTSDGEVSAEVTLKDGRRVEVRERSWVLVTPPKFAPPVEPLTTLWERALEVAEEKWPEQHPRPRQVSFREDVYPLLRSLSQYQWVNRFALSEHGAGMVFDPLDDTIFPLLHDKGRDPSAADMRLHVFRRLRKPIALLRAEHPELPLGELLVSPAATALANSALMPQMFGDGGAWVSPSATENQIPGGAYITYGTLSPRQYELLRRWSAGDFVDDWPAGAQPAELPPRRPLQSYPPAEQPRALDRAALEPCIGGPFYPGIEITYICEDPALWAELGRLDWRRLSPGDITRHMALPWQADFSECNTRWWPAQRPDDVVSEEQYEAVVRSYDQTLDGPLADALATRVSWARGLPADSPMLDNAMIEHWHDMGFVVPKHGPDDQVVFIERGRGPFAGSTLRDAFYYLMNISSYTAFLPKAKRLVEGFLEQARRNEVDPEVNASSPGLSPFPYSPEAFDARLQQIYNQGVQGNFAPGSQDEALTQRTREQEIYRLVQMAPFNQLDGAWIRQAAPPGTVDEVRNLLFNIYMDELGDAKDQHNHANYYTDVLRGLNIYLPDIRSRAYADDPRFLDSAFVEPVFLLAISQFTEEYLPEILGMTLYLEWSSVALQSTVQTLESFGIDPGYYRLHVAIDNAASGHGAMAKRAVELYLDQVREQGGDEALQAAWARIWDGYVAFGTLGTLQQDIDDHFAQPPTLQDAMVAMINSKAFYGSQNHGNKRLGPNAINDWLVSDPAGMLVALQEAGYVVPGKPEISPIFELMSFQGPMFHVFDEAEQQLWRDWILSLDAAPKPPAYDQQKALLYIIDSLRQRQQGVAGHHVRLAGPDPRRAGERVTQSIADWFNVSTGSDQGNADALLLALRDPENGWIVPGAPSDSPWLVSQLGGNGPMAEAFREVVPDTGGLTFKQVFAQWIEGGCPVAGELAPSFLARAVAAPAAPAPRKRRRYGMGKVH